MTKTLALDVTSFKFADNETDLSFRAMQNGVIISDSTLSATIKIKQVDVGYLKSVSAKWVDKHIVISSGDLSDLPVGSYSLELWLSSSSGYEIYPDSGFVNLYINQNATGISGNLISSITLGEFQQQFSDLGEELMNRILDVKVGPQGEKGDAGQQGVQGIQGIQGERGERGEQGERGMQGIQGVSGKDFSIAETFPSVSAMSGEGLTNGDFVMISSTVEDPDNAKMYIWNGAEFTFITDMSGAIGVKGDTGEQGIQGEQGVQGERGDQGIQGVQGVHGEKGEKGDKGDKGDQGIQGIQGIPGKDSVIANAASASKLEKARKLGVNLQSSTPQNFDGTTDVTNVGVTGVLPIANGGNGNAFGLSNSISYLPGITSLLSIVVPAPFSPNQLIQWTTIVGTATVNTPFGGHAFTGSIFTQYNSGGTGRLDYLIKDQTTGSWFVGSGNTVTYSTVNNSTTITAQSISWKKVIDIDDFPIGTIRQTTTISAPTIGVTWTQIGTQVVGSKTTYFWERTA